MLINQIIHFGLERAGNRSKRAQPPVAAQEKELRRLLTKAKDTALGRAYGFSGLLKEKDIVSAYQQRVPLVDYDTIFNPWWERVYEGCKDITWPGRPEYFAMSSGTSGAATKYIPVTKTMLKALSAGAFRMFSAFPDYDLGQEVYTSSWLSIGGTTHLESQGGRKFGYLSGINAREQPVWARQFYKPGRKIAAIPDFEERLEAIAQQAPNWNIGVIVGIPHWIQLTLERIVEMHQLKDISDIWPDLKLFVSGGVDYLPYVDSFTRLIGYEIKYMNTYLASEGMFAFQRSPGDPGMKLITDNRIFYEFLPFNDENFDEEGNLRQNLRPVTIGEVTTKTDYAMLITTCSGAWRYLLGDTIQFLDTERMTIRVSGRTKHYINLATEHVTVDNMNAGIAAVKKELGVEITEFTIVPVKDDRYIAHEWYLAVRSPADVNKIRETLDAALSNVNEDYASERKTALQIKVELVSPESFMKWQRLIGQVNGQSKVPRVMKGRGKDIWLELMNKQNSSGITNQRAVILAEAPWGQESPKNASA